MSRKVGVALLAVAALVVVAAVGYGVLRGADSLFPASHECTVEVDGHRVDLTVEQAENAALITAISVRRGLPARAASIALATAYQESDLTNLESGDRDSLGLFQQRPSQGWGTPEEILDPVHATNAFYDALAEVDGPAGHGRRTALGVGQRAEAQLHRNRRTGHHCQGREADRDAPGARHPQSFACRAALRAMPSRCHGTASIAPETELRRNSTLLAPDSSRALTTRGLLSRSLIVTLVPAVT